MAGRGQPYKGQRKEQVKQRKQQRKVSLAIISGVLGTKHHPVWLEDAE